jgi:hypothetical protein
MKNVIIRNASRHSYPSADSLARSLKAEYFFQNFVPPNGCPGILYSDITDHHRRAEKDFFLIRLLVQDIINTVGKATVPNLIIGKFFNFYYLDELKRGHTYVDVIVDKEGYSLFQFTNLLEDKLFEI